MRTTVDTNGSAAGLTSYGSAAFPYPFSPLPTVTAGAHNHLPTPAALKILIDAYRKAPFTNPDGLFPTGIWPHFDVGDPTNYINELNNDPLNTNPHVDYTPFFVPSNHAKGRRFRRRGPMRVGRSAVSVSSVPRHRWMVQRLPQLQQRAFQEGPQRSRPLRLLRALTGKSEGLLSVPGFAGPTHDVQRWHQRVRPFEDLRCRKPGGRLPRSFWLHGHRTISGWESAGLGRSLGSGQSCGDG